MGSRTYYRRPSQFLVSKERLNVKRNGIFPNPAEESAKQCGIAYNKFVQDYPDDDDVNVMLCAYGTKEYQDAKNELRI